VAGISGSINLSDSFSLGRMGSISMIFLLAAAVLRFSMGKKNK